MHFTIDCKNKKEFGCDLNFSYVSSISCIVLIAFYGDQDIAVKKVVW